MKALAAALMIGLMMFASSAGAQGVLNQLGGWRGGSTHEAVRPEVACKRFETTLEMRNIDAWGAFEVVPDRPPVRADLAEAALQRLGGTRLVMAADAALLRKDLVEAGRDDVRRIVRNARLGSPAAVTIDGDTIRFRPRVRCRIGPARSASTNELDQHIEDWHAASTQYEQKSGAVLMIRELVVASVTVTTPETTRGSSRAV